MLIKELFAFVQTARRELKRDAVCVMPGLVLRGNDIVFCDRVPITVEALSGMLKAHGNWDGSVFDKVDGVLAEVRHPTILFDANCLKLYPFEIGDCFARFDRGQVTINPYGESYQVSLHGNQHIRRPVDRLIDIG